MADRPQTETGFVAGEQAGTFSACASEFGIASQAVFAKTAAAFFPTMRVGSVIEKIPGAAGAICSVKRELAPAGVETCTFRVPNSGNSVGAKKFSCPEEGRTANNGAGTLIIFTDNP